MSYAKDHAHNPCRICGTAPGVLCEHDEPGTEARSAAPGDPVTVMAICETEQLILHVNQLYRFVVMPDCARCAELARIGTAERHPGP